MKKILLSILVRIFLKDFVVIDRRLSDGEYASAMAEISGSRNIRSYLSITTANLIRRHLYIKDMGEGNWYLGQIAAIRKIQTDADEWARANGTQTSENS